MKINKISLNNNNIAYGNNKNTQSLSVQKEVDKTNLNNMPSYPIISFGAKSNKEKLAYIGVENFPNPEILKRYTKAIEANEDVLLCQIHKDFYSKLLDCNSLDEAKEIYPEFSGVINAKDIPTKEYNSALKKIANNEVEGVTIEDLSLIMLKKHYAEALGYARKEDYFGLDAKTNQNLFNKLNIKILNREYFLTINRETPERRAICAQNTQKLWQDSEYREGRSEDARKRWENPEYREMRERSLEQQWADPKKREAQAEAMRRMHQVEGFEEKRIASIKKGWQDPQRREELLKINQQNVASRWANPENRAKMSEFMKKKWQDPKYRETICSGISERMKERWKDPLYIAFKTDEKLAQWADPEFREYMSETMKAHWEDPQYREKMAIYSEALKLAWEMHPEISEEMSRIADEFPGLGKILTKYRNGGKITQQEEKLMMAYYKKCHQVMPNFTWIVGQTQKEILAEWKKNGDI